VTGSDRPAQKVRLPGMGPTWVYPNPAVIVEYVSFRTERSAILVVK
jgi:hypothetical protein